MDLKEAYYSVPIDQQSQDLRIWWEGRPFKFTCLPFGLSSVPRTFTKLLKPLVAYLREKGICLIIYIDDILLLADTKEKATLALLTTLNLLEFMGFLVNYEKSVLVPSQRIEFLGFHVNSTNMSIALPQEKVQKIYEQAQLLLINPTPSAREITRLVGTLSSSIPAVTPAPLHYRALQATKNKAVASGGYDCRISPPRQPGRNCSGGANTLRPTMGSQ